MFPDAFRTSRLITERRSVCFPSRRRQWRAIFVTRPLPRFRTAPVFSLIRAHEMGLTGPMTSFKSRIGNRSHRLISTRVRAGLLLVQSTRPTRHTDLEGGVLARLIVNLCVYYTHWSLTSRSRR